MRLFLCCLRERERRAQDAKKEGTWMSRAAGRGVLYQGREKKKREDKSVDGWRAHELDRNASALDFAPALAAHGRGSRHFKDLYSATVSVPKLYSLPVKRKLFILITIPKNHKPQQLVESFSLETYKIYA